MMTSSLQEEYPFFFNSSISSALAFLCARVRESGRVGIGAIGIKEEVITRVLESVDEAIDGSLYLRGFVVNGGTRFV